MIKNKLGTSQPIKISKILGIASLKFNLLALVKHILSKIQFSILSQKFQSIFMSIG